MFAVLCSIAAAIAVLVTPSPTPTASPAPSASPGYREITRVVGRATNLVGSASSSSTGTISQEQIATRPIVRPAEVLEAIPGLVISQHSGGGKANQYYLRGFQLDHGTDLAATIAGFPVNLPTHAHGQGYSDINYLLPEVVSFVEFKKGPYFADQGDFSTAGAYVLQLRSTISPIADISFGSYGYSRALIARSLRVNSGNLLYAFELLHDNGSLARPDDYRKINGVLRWSHSAPNVQTALTALGYSGTFDSSDQIPQRLVDAGSLARNGYVDPSDGGYTSHYGLSYQGQWLSPKGRTSVDVYGFEQYLDLFSNFTYYLDDATDYYNLHANPITCDTRFPQCVAAPNHVASYTSYCPANATPGAFTFSCGDQREQQDRRFVSGFRLEQLRAIGSSELTAGVGLRADNISTLGLFLTNARVRYAAGTLSNDRVLERTAYAYVSATLHAGKLRVLPGLRADAYTFRVGAPATADSGNVAAGIVSPKLSLAYAPSRTQELYLNYGQSFHSNDGRGLTQTLDPKTHRPFDPNGNAVARVSPLVRAAGEEIGYRLSTRRLTSSVALWQLNLASELVFDGDHGVTFAGRPAVRRGIEIANFYQPAAGVTYDADFSTSSAAFLTDPDRIGTRVPESLRAVASAGVTIDRAFSTASLRARYFGPRALIEDGSAYSRPSLMFNGEYTAKFSRGARLRLEVLNVFNARSDDVEYYYASWLPQDANASPANTGLDPALGGAGVSDYHFHPSAARAFRLTLQLVPGA